MESFRKEGLMMKEYKRGAGILLPVTALPSPFGIGSFGKEAFHFVDQLEQAGQKYWQVLPMGPTSFGDSPYQALSAFAGNPYFIDMEGLIEEGLLTREEVEESDYGDTSEFVQYDKIYESRFPLLKKAFEQWKVQVEKKDTSIKQVFEQFVIEEKDWLDNYALYMACKIHFGQKEWSLWEDGIKARTEQAVSYYEGLLADEITFWKFIQFRFYSEWRVLKNYANGKGIEIIGDIPLYVSYDSADVWAEPKLFQLNEDLQLTNVAGCPPDAFSDDGQKWGNPLYDWKEHENQGFIWWKKRMKSCAKLYDLTRIDHFIGIVRYYCIPYDKTAKFGWYEKGPGIGLVNAINEAIGDAKVIAEDLGVSGPDVVALLEKSGFPGMKELEVAFDGNPKNDHLPHFHKKHGVVYIGTHDNETLKGHILHESNKKLAFMMEYIGADSQEEIIRKMMRVLYMSVSDIIMLQMQDVLEKDNTARMNFPSTIGINWKWRLQKEEFSEKLCEELKELAFLYNRS